MGYASNNNITSGDICDAFTNQVYNVILNGAVDVNSVPRDGGYVCIQTERLGNKNTLPRPSIPAKSGNTINALQIYENLVSITTILTRVGTWSYLRTYGVNNGRRTDCQRSGKALFNESYIRTLSRPNNFTVLTNRVISISGLNALFAALLSAYNNTDKHHNSIHHALCHSNCHSNCHSDCHNDCNCYK